MKEKLFYKELKAGSSTIHVSVSKSIHEEIYLKLSQLKKDKDNIFKWNSFFVFEEYIPDFLDIINEALEIIDKNIEFLSIHKNSESYNKFEEINNKAYKLWTILDDNLLEENISKGMKINELSILFGRTKGAIRSRIKKLMLQY